MTRKQALQNAIALLSESPESSEEVRILQEISDELPLIHWSDSSIRDTVDQFILENNRVPTVSDFRKKGMPPHPVIKQKYGITLREWLEQNYPVKKRPTHDERKEKYTKDFLEDYYRIKPRSQQDFNRNRCPDTKAWQTIAYYHNTSTWRNLLKALNLPLYFDMRRDHVPPNFTVNFHVDYDFRD